MREQVQEEGKWGRRNRERGDGERGREGETQGVACGPSQALPSFPDCRPEPV